MRDYLYLWNNHNRGAIVASGVEFRDFIPHLRDGIVLLKSHFWDAVHGPSGFNTVLAHSFDDVVKDNPHGYGDFFWCDATEWNKFSDDDIAALLFIQHTARPLRRVCLPSVGNTFFVMSHDDGWFLHLFYDDWKDIEPLVKGWLGKSGVSGKVQESAAQILMRGEEAVFVKAGCITSVEGTEDIDGLMNSGVIS